jgi:adenine phosphoribosyltransferase
MVRDLTDAEQRKQALTEVAKAIPVVPFKGVDAFFDIGGLLAQPAQLETAIELFASAIEPFIDEIDAIGCFDARGFLFAPSLGVRFQKKVFMLRKPDKMPSVSDTIEYFKEYQGDNATGGDHLSIQKYAVSPGDRVLLVDDLLATGGTVEAGIRLVQQAGGKIAGALFVVEIGVIHGRERAEKAAEDLNKDRIISLLTEKDF